MRKLLQKNWSLFHKEKCPKNSAIIQSGWLKVSDRGLLHRTCRPVLPLACFVWIQSGVLQSSCLGQGAATLLSPIIAVWSKTLNKQNQFSSLTLATDLSSSRGVLKPIFQPTAHTALAAYFQVYWTLQCSELELLEPKTSQCREHSFSKKKKNCFWTLRWHYSALPVHFGQTTSKSQVPHLWDRSDISNFLVGLLSGLSGHLQQFSKAVSNISLELRGKWKQYSIMEYSLFLLCVQGGVLSSLLLWTSGKKRLGMLQQGS